MTTDEKIQKHFRFRGRNRNLPWYPRFGDRNHLAILLKNLGFNEGVEIGTYRGHWARYLLDTNPNLHLTCVDPWITYYMGGRTPERQEQCYNETIGRLKGLNADIVRKTSMDAVGSFKDESLDFVYLDANHLFDFVIMDMIHWIPKVKYSGIVALHDYHHQVGSDVVWAINAYTQTHHIDPWYITREEHPTAYWVRKIEHTFG